MNNYSELSYYISYVVLPNILAYEILYLYKHNRLDISFYKLTNKIKKIINYDYLFISKWSGWQDLNLQPHGPKPCALPNWATSRNTGAPNKIFTFLLTML